VGRVSKSISSASGMGVNSHHKDLFAWAGSESSEGSKNSEGNEGKEGSEDSGGSEAVKTEGCRG
jgi:hypothetical protein